MDKRINAQGVDMTKPMKVVSRDFPAVTETAGLDAERLNKNYQDLRVAAQQVLDDWNRVGAQSDGYRALRAALAALAAPAVTETGRHARIEAERALNRLVPLLPSTPRVHEDYRLIRAALAGTSDTEEET